jgi:hypothetical protein
MWKKIILCSILVIMLLFGVNSENVHPFVLIKKPNQRLNADRHFSSAEL